MKPEFLNLIESIQAEAATVQRLFAAEAGDQSVRNLRRRRQDDPRYMAQLTEAARFYGDVLSGKRPLWQFKEAMSTSDFPILFGDTLDRLVVADYRAMPSSFRLFLRVGTVADFRTVDRYRVSDGDQRLDQVPQGGNYPAGSLDEAGMSFKVNKYGRTFNLLWEALVNDDLDALRSVPTRMARAALRTEQHFASSLYVANTTLFTVGHVNKGTAKLTPDSLVAGWNALVVIGVDANGEPIFNMPRYLVVPPVLELKARQIVGSMQLAYAGGDSAAASVAVAYATDNPMQGRLEVQVDPYLPVVDPTNGNTSWYLLADPDNGHVAEIAFLRGYEEPGLYMKASNQVRLGGGPADVMEGDFETDAVHYKVRHVVGGAHANALDNWRFGYWSDGTV